ncbi:hypothetical protein GCM10023200_52050 [Actinomycetospora chlora]|uniref:Uncharacterized protein n=1 Tax=Actinomycetospora chlora TaxID=663608 RepID=A0ABP9CBR4_9PSEU
MTLRGRQTGPPQAVDWIHGPAALSGRELLSAHVQSSEVWFGVLVSTRTDNAVEVTLTRGLLRRWAFILDGHGSAAGLVGRRAVAEAIRAVLCESERAEGPRRQANEGPPFAPELADAAQHPRESS